MFEGSGALDLAEVVIEVEMLVVDIGTGNLGCLLLYRSDACGVGLNLFATREATRIDRSGRTENITTSANVVENSLQSSSSLFYKNPPIGVESGYQPSVEDHEGSSLIATVALYSAVTSNSSASSQENFLW